MKKIFQLTVILVLVVFACKRKDQFENFYCANAELCITNKTTQTVYYCVDCINNNYTDSIIAGGKSCFKAGEVSILKERGVVLPNNSVIPVKKLNTSKGNFSVTVDECNELFEIN